MTSEVVLMNRHAVALAADSATTVTYWHQGEREERYFQGANKIFNLSEKHPVGLMTYGSGNLQGVPWEVVVKAFRRHLGSSPHRDLDGYAQALFKFIEENRRLLPEDYLEKQLETSALNQAYFMMASILVDSEYMKAKDEKSRLLRAETVYQEKKRQVMKAELLGNASESDVDKASCKVQRECGQPFI